MTFFLFYFTGAGQERHKGNKIQIYSAQATLGIYLLVKQVILEKDDFELKSQTNTLLISVLLQKLLLYVKPFLVYANRFNHHQSELGKVFFTIPVPSK